MNILVTGAAGFIGASLAEALVARGHRVIGIDNLNPYYAVSLKRDRLARVAAAAGEAFHFIECDFGDHDALENALEGHDFDRIVHLGAQPGVRYSLENSRAYAHSNISGHLNMLELGRERGVDL